MQDDDRAITLPSFGRVVAVCLIIGAGWYGWGGIRESYQRQALWDSTALPTERMQAVESWAQMGRAAVPTMRQALADSDPKVRHYAALALGRIGPQADEAVPDLVRCMDDEDQLVRLCAIAALGSIGREPETVIPQLTPLLAEPKCRNDAANSLVQFGSAAEAKVIALLRSSDPFVRCCCVFILREMETTDETAICEIRRLLTDTDDGVRQAAFHTLGSLDLLSIDDVVIGMRDSNRSTVVLALEHLSGFGGSSRQALGELIPLCRNPDPTIRYCAFAALKSVVRPDPQRSSTDRMASLADAPGRWNEFRLRGRSAEGLRSPRSVPRLTRGQRSAGR